MLDVIFVKKGSFICCKWGFLKFGRRYWGWVAWDVIMDVVEMSIWSLR